LFLLTTTRTILGDSQSVNNDNYDSLLPTSNHHHKMLKMTRFLVDPIQQSKTNARNQRSWQDSGRVLGNIIPVNHVTGHPSIQPRSEQNSYPRHADYDIWHLITDLPRILAQMALQQNPLQTRVRFGRNVVDHQYPAFTHYESGVQGPTRNVLRFMEEQLHAPPGIPTHNDMQLFRNVRVHILPERQVFRDRENEVVLYWRRVRVLLIAYHRALTAYINNLANTLRPGRSPLLVGDFNQVPAHYRPKTVTPESVTITIYMNIQWMLMNLHNRLEAYVQQPRHVINQQAIHVEEAQLLQSIARLVALVSFSNTKKSDLRPAIPPSEKTGIFQKPPPRRDDEGGGSGFALCGISISRMTLC